MLEQAGTFICLPSASRIPKGWNGWAVSIFLNWSAVTDIVPLKAIEDVISRSKFKH